MQGFFRSLKILPILLAAAALAGCNTTQEHDFQKVHAGMDKSDVVEQAGSPTVSTRQNGQDRWIYEFDGTPGDAKRREIFFQDGRAVYVGPKIPPKVTAEEQDRINEQSNIEEDSRLAQEQADYDRRMGVARVQPIAAGAPSSTPPGTNQPDLLDLRLRDSMYGTDSAKSLEQNVVAPDFEPVQ